MKPIDHRVVSFVLPRSVDVLVVKPHFVVDRVVSPAADISYRLLQEVSVFERADLLRVVDHYLVAYLRADFLRPFKDRLKPPTIPVEVLLFLQVDKVDNQSTIYFVHHVFSRNVFISREYLLSPEKMAFDIPSHFNSRLSTELNNGELFTTNCTKSTIYSYLFYHILSHLSTIMSHLLTKYNKS